MSVHTEKQGGRRGPPGAHRNESQQDNPGGLLFSSARFRFSCQAHSATSAPDCQAFCSQWPTVPFRRVSTLDTVQAEGDGANGGANGTNGGANGTA
jgi:hypothetical protein